MKLTRREMIFGFTATSVFLVSKYGMHPVKAMIANNTEQESIYQEFLQAAAGGVEDKPVLFYQGIKTSPYQNQINDYPLRLKQKPNGKTLIDGTKADTTFRPYPAVGKLPKINEEGLLFLHEDIKEACICVGSFSGGSFKARWLGRNALNNDQFWSATKFITLLHTANLLNQKLPGTDIAYYNIKGLDQDKNQRNLSFTDLARDMISYEENIATSNALGGMFKKFTPQIALETWLKSITGNHELVLRGKYGENPFIEAPQLIKRITNQLILTPDLTPPEWGSNTISAYDLTRIISMLGWHNYLPQNSQLPFISHKSLDTIIKSMGTDPARLTDLAIKKLGLENALDSVVIISKLGNGATSTKERTEAVYVALIQFIDRRPQAFKKPAKLFTLSMALRGASSLKPRNLDREVVELDARMATEVTEIIKRTILGILA
jgi:hypothetical protein